MSIRADSISLYFATIYVSSATDSLGGFSRGEMILYVLMSYTISDIVMIGVSSEIGRDVVDGSAAMNLAKPINYRTYLTFKSLGVTSVF